MTNEASDEKIVFETEDDMKLNNAQIAVVVCMFLLARIAWAGPNEDAAREAVKKATVTYNLGQYEASAVLYEEAYRLVQDPALLYNIGQSYRMANKPDKATTAYKAYLRTAPDDAPAREQAQKKLDELEWATFGPGNPHPTIPMPARVTPIPIPPVMTPAQVKIKAEAPTPTPTPWKKWAPWIATGVTTALGTSSIITGLSANSAFNRLQGTCGKTGTCTNSQVDGVKSQTTITNVLWGLTAASTIATGAVFFYAWRY